MSINQYSADAPTITTHLLPPEPHFEPLTGQVAVVIDILRATSTISVALSRGAQAVIPFEAIEDATQYRDEQSEPVLLGGERGGQKIPGFDFGNSPYDYEPEIIAGKKLGFTTTNGTRALHRCRQARLVLLGSFLTLSSIVDRLLQEEGDIHLVCAGTDRVVTLEDCLFAGAVASLLVSANPTFQLDDASQLCRMLYEQAVPLPDGIHQTLLASQGGRNLQGLNMQADIKFCAQQDRLTIVPIWNPTENRITILAADSDSTE